MRFADIIGNRTAVDALASMADSGRVAHAMLFYENEGCGLVRRLKLLKELIL